jgi:S1-C subfamily serine protease
VIAPKQDESIVLVGDVLLEAEGKVLDDVAALLETLARKETADMVQLRLIRGGVIQTIDAAVRALEQV